MPHFFSERNLILILIGFIFSFYLTSCSSAKYLPYFKDVSQDIRDSTSVLSTRYESKILPDDILIIQVGGDNPEVVAPFNQSSASSSSISSNYWGASSTQSSIQSQVARQVIGYKVDSVGNIDFPILGTLHLSGLSLSQAEDTIKALLKPYVSNPTVIARFLNYKISVMGEVGHPGTYEISDPKVTVLQALSMAGDITVFGKRRNVLVIREIEGKRSMGRINMHNSKDVFSSPFYYLRQNDIVYVEPHRSSLWNRDNATIRNTSAILSILSTAAVLISIFK